MFVNIYYSNMVNWIYDLGYLIEYLKIFKNKIIVLSGSLSSLYR